MSVHTDYLWFNTAKRQEFIRITDEVGGIVEKSGVKEGLVLVSAMHITAGVYVNDWEDGLIHDIQTWFSSGRLWGSRWSYRSLRADSISDHGSRSSTPSSMVRAESGSSSK